MTATVTALSPFADALASVVSADTVLPTLALLPGKIVTVAAALPRDKRINFPYVIVGDRRELNGTGFAMQVEGGTSNVFIDVWSEYNGPAEVQDIQARLRTLLLRDPQGAVARALFGVVMFGGSLVCDEEQAFRDADPAMPERTLYHGVQRWTADLEAVA